MKEFIAILWEPKWFVKVQAENYSDAKEQVITALRSQGLGKSAQHVEDHPDAYNIEEIKTIGVLGIDF